MSLDREQLAGGQTHSPFLRLRREVIKKPGSGAQGKPVLIPTQPLYSSTTTSQCLNGQINKMGSITVSISELSDDREDGRRELSMSSPQEVLNE